MLFGHINDKETWQSQDQKIQTKDSLYPEAQREAVYAKTERVTQGNVARVKAIGNKA